MNTQVYVPDELYAKIVESMPLLCVDVILHNRVGSHLVLVYRNQEPAKGKWWLVGGRLLKGEHLKHAVIRKCKEEVGIEVWQTPYFIGVYEQFFDSSAQDVPAHTVNLVYAVEAKSSLTFVKLDSTSDEFKIVSYDEVLRDDSYDQYLKRVIKDWVE